MLTGRISAGARMRLDGQVIRLVKKATDDSWQIEDEATARLSMISERELHRYWESERLQLLPRNSSAQIPSPVGRSLPIESLKPSEQARVRLRVQFLREMGEHYFPGWRAKVPGQAKSAFDHALCAVSLKLGLKRPCSATTFYQWRAALQLADGDVTALKGNYGRGRAQIDARAKKIIDDRMSGLIEAATRSGRPRKPLKIAEIIDRCEQAIMDENELIRRANEYAERISGETQRLIKLPSSRSTYYNHWNRYPAYQRAIVTDGPTIARMNFRGGPGWARPEACLDRVEYDETPLPFFVYDEGSGVALGRPWLSWFLCCSSQLVIGLYLGFEQSSDLSLMSAMRSACLPKAFLSDEFPGVGDYPVFGIARSMVFDNPMSQHGNTILSLTDNLHISHQFAPSSTPWFKARVESSFNVVNRQLIMQLPGAALKGVSTKDYDPTKHGCLGFRALHQLTWKWIVNLHAIQPHTELNIPRLDYWKENTLQNPPALIDSKRRLDELFWVVRRGSLTRGADHRGVMYEKLRYYSPELDLLRREFGASAVVAVKINPADLEFILVRANCNVPWVRVRAVQYEYARGLSLHIHLACRKKARASYGSEQVDALKRARYELAREIASLVDCAQSIGATTVAARALGVGTQVYTDNLDHDGQLAVARSPALPAPLAIGSSPDVEPIVPALLDLPAAAPAEALPRFDSDLSLQRSEGPA